MRTIPSRVTTILIALLLSGLSGCAATSRQNDQADARPRADCLVCKYNADLACVNLRVDERTLNTVYQGTTYYFCSDECRAAFERDPAKYLPH